VRIARNTQVHFVGGILESYNFKVLVHTVTALL